MEYRGVTAVAQPEVTTEVAGLPTATNETTNPNPAGQGEEQIPPYPQSQAHCGNGQWWNSTPSKAAQRKMEQLSQAQSKYAEALARRTDLNFQLVTAISSGNQKEVVKIQRQILSNEKDILHRGQKVAKIQTELTQMGVPYANYQGNYESQPERTAWGVINYDPYAVAIQPAQ